ncbi:BACON domain-containing protein, partial [Kitasatospora nipponensis]|uniref:BACON domain-containing protein n=1 Tax=Kitasatospora nipponensis TaxID=258049 RepID=UPI003CD06C75
PATGAAAVGTGAGRRWRATDPVRSIHFDQRGFPRHRAPTLWERHRPGGDLHERTVLVRQRALTTGVLAAVLSAPLAALWVAHRDGSVTEAAATVSAVRVDDGAGGGPGEGGPAGGGTSGTAPSDRPGDGATAALPGPGADGGSNPVTAAGSPGGRSGFAVAGLVGAVGRPGRAGGPAAGAETLLPALQGAAVAVPAPGAVPLDSPVLRSVPVPPPGSAGGGTPSGGARLTVQAGAYGPRTVLTLTNSGDAPIDWHAVVSCDWLRLSRDAGSLAPGQRITVTVTVDDQRAPQDHWTAQISLPPSEAVVTLEGGPDRGQSPTPSPSGATPSPSTSSSPSTGSTPSASAKPSGTASSSPSETPTAGGSASSAPSSSVSPSASPTSGPSASTTPSPRPSSPPSATPSPSATASAPASSPPPTSATSNPSPSPTR